MLTSEEKTAINTHYKIVAKHLPGFRPRHAQREMIATIARVLGQAQQPKENTATTDPADDTINLPTGAHIAVIEGPTGVGKSLAYLLPGIIMAQHRQKKLIVSSATVALQEQLVLRDLPRLAEDADLTFSYALAKGRGRYLCPYRLYQRTQASPQADMLDFNPQALLSSRPDPADQECLQQLADDFAQRRFNGDRDDYPITIKHDLWQSLTSDYHSCLKKHCPNYAECPFFLARETLKNTDVIVVNHDLLLSDLNMGGGIILPPPQDCFYVMDEAHHLPQKAIKRFAASHSLQGALTLLKRLPKMVTEMAKITDSSDQTLNALDNSLIDLISSLKEWETFLNQSAVFDAADPTDNEIIWRWPLGQIPNGLTTLVNNSAQASQALQIACNQLLTSLDKKRHDATLKDLINHMSQDFGVIISRIEEISQLWQLMAQNQDKPDNQTLPLAKWIALSRQENLDYVFAASPISASSDLRKLLWRRASAAILTSATLKGSDQFRLFLKQTGLAALPEVTTLALESPFDFSHCAELYIPPLQHAPSYKNTDLHTAEIIEWLPKLIDPKTAVGTLVLFTSRRQMQDVARQLNADYQALLQVQGDKPKAQLLREHHDALAHHRPSIIFGLASFAEGLDLPGQTCVHVIIAKLPFTVPDDPVSKTLSEWLESQGRNPFIELSLPEASIKLIQATGRLIRSESDYGRVTILDKRIITARYGATLLNALPPFRRI